MPREAEKAYRAGGAAGGAGRPGQADRYAALRAALDGRLPHRAADAQAPLRHRRQDGRRRPGADPRDGGPGSCRRNHRPGAHQAGTPHRGGQALEPAAGGLGANARPDRRAEQGHPTAGHLEPGPGGQAVRRERQHRAQAGPPRPADHGPGGAVGALGDAAVTTGCRAGAPAREGARQPPRQPAETSAPWIPSWRRSTTRQ